MPYDSPRPSSQPIGSTDLAVAKDNLITHDNFVSGPSGTVITNRKGQSITPLVDIIDNANALIIEAINDAGGIPLGDGQWAAGKTYTAYNQFLVFNGIAYKPISVPYLTQGADPTLPPDLGNVTPFQTVDEIKTIELSLNKTSGSVIYSTDTVSAIPGVLYAGDQDVIYRVPFEAIGKTITSLIVDELTTSDTSVYTLQKYVVNELVNIAHSLNKNIDDVGYGDPGEIVKDIVFVAEQQVIYSVPALAIGKFISSVSGSTLNTTEPASYPLTKIEGYRKIFANVDEMKNNSSHYAGSIVKTTSYYDGWALILGRPLGGAEYIITPIADFDGTPDGYGDHLIAGGVFVAMLDRGSYCLNAAQFGVKPDDYTVRVSNFEAIQAVTLAAITRNKDPLLVNPLSGSVHLDFTGNTSIEYPAGVIYIEGNSPFHVDPVYYEPPITTYGYRRGLTIKGQGKESTIFEMVKGAEVGDQWFYKNDYPSANAFGWDEMTWEGCTFRSQYWQWYNNTGAGSEGGFVGLQTRAAGDKYGAFYMNSNGFEKVMTWKDCKFAGFDTAFFFTGTGNVDSQHWINCLFSVIRSNILVLDNGESIAHTFDTCEFIRIPGNFVAVTENGGGIVNINGGSIVIYPEYNNAGPIVRTTEAAFFRLEPTLDSLKMRASEFHVTGATFEKYDPKYQLVNIIQSGTVVDVGDVVEPRYPASSCKIDFRYCSFSTDAVQTNDLVNFAENHDVLTINGDVQAEVIFDHCSHNTRHFYKAVGQTIAYSGGSKIEFISPRLLWDPVRDNIVPVSWSGSTLSDRCDVGNYVRVECNDAISNFSPQWASKWKWFNLDFSINKNPLLTNHSVKNRIARVKPAGHLSRNTADTAGLGNTASLGSGAVIVGWEIYVPIAGGTPDINTWRVYTTDGAVLILSESIDTSVGLSKRIDLDPADFITLSTTDPRVQVKWFGAVTRIPDASYINAIYR